MLEASAATAQTTDGLTAAAQSIERLVEEAQWLQRGGWSFSAPGEACGVIFTSPHGFVRIDGPRCGSRLPTATFFSPQVPALEQPRLAAASF